MSSQDSTPASIKTPSHIQRKIPHLSLFVPGYTKSLLSTITIICFVLSLFVSVNPIHAQILPPSPSPEAPGSKVVTLATVNIQNARLVSQEGNILQISFDLTNRVTPQNGVKYGVMLVSTKDGNQFPVASQVYDEVLMLPEHSSIHKVIVYTAPTSLQGSFDLVLTSENANGFPFAIAKVGKVEFTASGGVEIFTDTCYLTIQDDVENTHYTLRQGVDISPEESLLLHCDVQNHGEAFVATSKYTTHYRTTYGEVVSHEGGDSTPIPFAAKEKKTISLALPKATAAQAYDVVMTLGESNPVDIHYVLQGDSATIQNLSLDKNYYQKGETARLSFLWSAAADTFIGSRRYGTSTSSTTLQNPPLYTMSMSMINKEGVVCVESTTQSITKSKMDISLPIINTCTNPHLLLDILDASGKVLAHEELVLTSEQSQGGWLYMISRLWFVALCATLLILGVAGAALFYFKRHHAQV